MGYGNGGEAIDGSRYDLQRNAYQAEQAALTNINKAPRPIGIPEALDEQTKCAAELHQVVGLLRDRLTLVLSPEPPSGENATSGGIEPPVPTILARIQDHSRQIRAASSMLGQLMQRLQL